METIWKELTEEFEEELKWLNITTDSIWDTGREHKMECPFTQSELKLIEVGQNGQFPDDLVKIEDTQIHCVTSQTY